MNGVPFRVPEPFPVNSLKAARGALVLEHDAHRVDYIHACFRAYWQQGRDISQDSVLLGIVAALGLDVPAFRKRIADPAVKARLQQETEEAWDRGVFGTPTFFYGDEMLWGNDRLPVLEQLAKAQSGMIRGIGDNAPHADIHSSLRGDALGESVKPEAQ
jgi:2-hydroxychromene-2-carboxylate isomerase